MHENKKNSPLNKQYFTFYIYFKSEKFPAKTLQNLFLVARSACGGARYQKIL